MARVRMGIDSLLMGMGPIPSLVVLRPMADGEEHEGSATGIDDAKLTRATPGDGSDPAAMADEALATKGVLPIRIGMFESAAIGMGVDESRLHTRPMTHDLLRLAIVRLGAKVVDVSIDRVDGSTFYASVNLTDASGEAVTLDSRPSDAIALAVRCDVPIYASDEVLGIASCPDFSAIKREEREREVEEFHKFVEGLSPEDFETANQRKK